MSEYARRLQEIADTINQRTEPLGDTLETLCWGALVADVAGMPFEQAHAYVGLPRSVFDDVVNCNRSLGANVRNIVMHERTHELARLVS